LLLVVNPLTPVVAQAAVHPVPLFAVSVVRLTPVP